MSSDLEKYLYEKPIVNERKYINKLGLHNFRKNLISKCDGIRTGLVGSLFFSSLFCYYFYIQERATRLNKQANIFSLISKNAINVNHEFVKRFNAQKHHVYTLFYRMPEKEFNKLYRFRRVEVTGNYDHDKEVLIEGTNNGQKGYNVYTPFYYYENTNIDLNSDMKSQDGQSVPEPRTTAGGIVVHRGWIPVNLKDRRTRPQDVNRNYFETIYGGLRFVTRSKLHDFSIPNDPSVDYWNNFSLDDLSEYWDFQNKFETNLCYIQEVDMTVVGLSENHDVFPAKTSITSFVSQNAKEIGCNTFPYYKQLFNITGTLTLFNLGLASLLI